VIVIVKRNIHIYMLERCAGKKANITSPVRFDWIIERVRMLLENMCWEKHALMTDVAEYEFDG